MLCDLSQHRETQCIQSMIDPKREGTDGTIFKCTYLQSRRQIINKNKIE
jgi:hypothetical protein